MARARVSLTSPIFLRRRSSSVVVWSPAAGTPLPAGARSGLNDWHRTGYGGPCPPVGRHRYRFTLYALDKWLTALYQPTRAAVEHAMAGHIVARAELVGMYRKTRA